MYFFFYRKANLLNQKQEKKKTRSACCTDAATDWPEKTCDSLRWMFFAGFDFRLQEESVEGLVWSRRGTVGAMG